MKHLNSKIYRGRVFHQRYRPKEHRLNYRVCSFLFDLDELEELDQTIPFFSYNRFNLLSFWNKDFGPSDGKALKPYVDGLLKDAGIVCDGLKVRVLCYPRIIGYIFNPLSVYYCYDSNETLKAVLYEVSNTFDERHTYLIEVAGRDAGSGILKQSCQKIFYVSPFMDVSGSYEFSLLEPGENISVLIDYFDQGNLMLKASFSGRAERIDKKSVLKIMAAYPLMTIKVMAGIHWEALKLWRKGLGLFKRPEPPKEPVSTGHYENMEAKS